jgi:sec-independent protein translocase protein TatC
MTEAEGQQQKNDPSRVMLDYGREGGASDLGAMASDQYAHLLELRRRLIACVVLLAICMGVSYHFSDAIFRFLIAPLEHAMQERGGTQRLIYTHMAEAFFTTIKLSFATALFAIMPVILIQIWRFVAPGLYQKERRVFLPFLMMTPLLFYAGAAAVYYGVIPMAWPFFLGFQTGAAETALPIQLEARISDYLSMLMTLVFAFGLCFQLPVLLLLLAKAGVIEAQSLRQKRKYMVILAFVFGAFLTPPDVVSQIGLAVPIVLLYELSIFMISVGEKRRNKDQNAESEGDDAA